MKYIPNHADEQSQQVGLGAGLKGDISLPALSAAGTGGHAGDATQHVGCRCWVKIKGISF